MKLAVRACALAFALLFTAVVTAQPSLPQGITRVTTVEGITEYRLANGLQVLLFRDPSKATITVNMTYLVGSVDESYGETGMAHLLEHLMFKGSKKFPDILAAIRSHGAQFNGTTSWDRTNYFETFDASDANLEWALDLESDRMINAFVAQEDLDTEMTVVRNEFEQGENSPTGVLFERVMSAAYLWHGYGNSPIGSRSDIENVPIPRLRAFYERHYQPDNAVLVIAGRFEEQRALELIAKYFSSIPRPQRELTDNYTVEPTQDGEREVVVRRVGDVQILMAGYHVPAGSHEDFVPLQIAAEVLGDVPSGRLYKALVEPGLASQIAVQEMQLRDPGMIVFFALVPKEKSLEAAREAMIATIDALAANPVTTEEVERIRNQAMSSFEQQMNNSQGIAIQLSSWAAIGDWRMLFLDRDRVRTASAESVQSAALKYFKPSNRTVGLFVPGDPDRSEIPARPDVTAMLQGYKGDQARADGEAFDPTPANIDARTTRVDLPGGVKLVMLPKETRGDAVNALIRLNYGDEKSLTGPGRLAGVTTQMLMRGTRAKSRQDIQDELARLQSQLNVGGGAGLASANIQSTRANLIEVLTLAIEVLREPAFPDAELATLKQQTITGLEASRSEPQAIVSRAYARHWARNYKPDDPRYVTTIDEDLAFINGVRTAQLRDFHKDFFGASNAEVVVIGDFDPEQVRALIASRLDGWKSPKPFSDVLNRYADLAHDAISQDFNTPDKENAMFLAGMRIEMRDSHPDYPAMLFGNYILGSGPASRLFGRIRGKEGLSYGVGSSFGASPRSDGASFTVNAIAAPQNAAKVEASFRDELATVLREGYTQEEFDAAKVSWAQGRQVSRAQDAGLVGTLGLWTHVGRTMAFDADLEAKVAALTVEQVRDAMNRHLDVNKMTFMKGGDFESVSAGAGGAP
ncbi:MAG TPA: pitrilysin family protein [Gammaproteobacteria bacterium]|nr:pitrilysin family protein [Gammaproteobacteria bacterium]